MRLLFLTFIFFLISCGSSPEEKVASAIDRAQTYLSKGRCDEALQELDEAQDLENAIYLQVLASAYACKADVEIVGVITEIQDIDTNNVFGDLSQMSFAQSANLTSFDLLKKSLNVILSSTSTVSQAARDDSFGKRKGQDLGMQPAGPPPGRDPMMLAMNAMGFEAMVLGNHEFNFGLKNLERARSDAGFPWLSANTLASTGGAVKPFQAYIVKTIAGVKVTGSLSFSQAVLEGALVALVPGEPFGEDRCVRLSFATSMEQIDKGLDRLEKLASKIRDDLGGDGDGDDRFTADETPPADVRQGFIALKDSTEKLVKELKRTSRFTISAAAIQTSNAVIKFARFLRIAP